MRTTVTLDDDTEQLVRERMRDKGVGFKQALNDAIRDGAEPRAAEPFRTRTYDMGEPLTDITKALQISAAIADEHIVEVLNRSSASAS